MVRWAGLPWESLETWGVSLQVIKTALAAGLAWSVAGLVFHVSKPYFAPLAAILSVQATIAESLSRGVQRILGVVAGIVLATLFTRWVGLSAWSLGLMVFIGMALATRLRLGPQGIPQVAISALMVMAIGAKVHSYAWYRLLETVLGALVAIAVSALLWPPDLTPQAADSLRLLAAALSGLLEGIQVDLVHGLNPDEANRHLIRARTIGGGLDEARRSLFRAETSLRWNPWNHGESGRIKRLKEGLDVLDHILIQIRGISRTLFVTADRDVRQQGGMLPSGLSNRLATILIVMGQALRHYALVVGTGSQTAVLHLDQSLARAADERRELFKEAVGQLADDGPRFVDIAAVLVDLEKMSQDLQVSSRLISPIMTP